MLRKASLGLMLGLVVLLGSACDSTPELCSKSWCAAMDAKSKSAWSLDDTANYAKYCVLELGNAVGSKLWCKSMEAKPKGDWTANEAADYTRHCVF